MHPHHRRFFPYVLLCNCMLIGILVSSCARPGMRTTTMTSIQPLASPTLASQQPFVVGRPYSLDNTADGGDLIMISATQFELIGHAQYAPIAGGAFDGISCGAIKQLAFTHPAGPIDITSGMPLGFKTNDNLFAKVAFVLHDGTVAISAVIYPTCA